LVQAPQLQNIKTTRPWQKVGIDLVGFFTAEDSLRLEWEDITQQTNGIDCGIFSIAAAIAICLGIDPTKCNFDIPTMRTHIIMCMKMGELCEFPHLSGQRTPQPPIVQDIPLVSYCRQPSSQTKMIVCIKCQKSYHINCDKNIK